MTLIWPSNPSAVISNQPRLHAFIICVADYPHLIDGNGTPAIDQLGLSQISTPFYTAPAIVDWLISSFSNKKCPLGSVELVLSPMTRLVSGSITGASVETATVKNIENAFERWKIRCDSNRGNIAFFYFCGHGIRANNDQMLLAEDFGNPSFSNRWRNCLNFDKFRLGMKSCKADIQLFFVDACRETPFGVLTQDNTDGQVLINARSIDQVTCSSVYYSSSEGKKGFGPSHEMTYFCRAVIESFNGLASSNMSGKWIVNSYSLSGALGQVMEWLKNLYNEPLTCSSYSDGYADIHEPGKAAVLTSVKCSCNYSSSVAEISINRGSDVHRSGVTDQKPLQCKVTPGDWVIKINFPGGEYSPSPHLQYTLMPPVFEGIDYP